MSFWMDLRRQFRWHCRLTKARRDTTGQDRLFAPSPLGSARRSGWTSTIARAIQKLIR